MTEKKKTENKTPVIKVKVGRNVEVPKIDGGVVEILASKKERIPGQTSRNIATDLDITIPEGYIGIVTAAHDLIGKYPLNVREQFTYPTDEGNLFVNLYNFSSYPEDIIVGQIIAKLRLTPVVEATVKSVK